MAEQTPLTVSQAVNVAKGAVTSIPTMVVLGEVTGFRGPNARSGHCYFQVEDDSCAMDAIVWRNTYARSGIRLRDGMQVLLTGKFDVYAATGRLSFIAKSITASGEGLLRQQVAQLARKLEREGLMDPARKRPVPRFCMRVCVVTSLSGSVIDDVKRTLRRRNPLVQLDCVGAQVQGPGAPQTIIRALRVAAASQPEAILLVRGGGSFEDLMTFNDEGLARAVAACPVPVVTGIGHEPDTSICDMVADKRCSTPTAAAESVAPALDEVYETILRRRERLGAAMSAIVERDQQQVQLLGNAAGRSMGARLSRERVSVEALARHRCLQDPAAMVEDRTNQLLQSEQRLHDAMPRGLARRSQELDREARRLEGVGERLLRPYEASLARSAASLDALSPLRVLARGYAVARDKDGKVLTNAASVQVGQDIDVMLGSGELTARVTETRTAGGGTTE